MGIFNFVRNIFTKTPRHEEPIATPVITTNESRVKNPCPICGMEMTSHSTNHSNSLKCEVGCKSYYDGIYTGTTSSVKIVSLAPGNYKMFQTNRSGPQYKVDEYVETIQLARQKWKAGELIGE